MQKASKSICSLWFLFVLLAADAFFLLMHLIRGGTNPLWHLDKESNFPTFYSGMLLLSVAVLILVFALRRARSWVKWGWVLVALGFLYLAFDEMLEIHEFWGSGIFWAVFKPQTFYSWTLFGYPVGYTYPSFSWVLVFGPFLVLAGILMFYLPFRSSLALRHFWLYYIGIACLLLVPVVEILGSFYFEQPHKFPYNCLMPLEEMLEMVGTSFILFNLWRLNFNPRK